MFQASTAAPQPIDAGPIETGHHNTYLTLPSQHGPSPLEHLIRGQGIARRGRGRRCIVMVRGMRGMVIVPAAGLAPAVRAVPKVGIAAVGIVEAANQGWVFAL